MKKLVAVAAQWYWQGSSINKHFIKRMQERRKKSDCMYLHCTNHVKLEKSKRLLRSSCMMNLDGFGALLTTFCNWLIQKNNNINTLLDMSDLDPSCSISLKKTS